MRAQEQKRVLGVDPLPLGGMRGKPVGQRASISHDIRHPDRVDEILPPVAADRLARQREEGVIPQRVRHLAPDLDIGRPEIPAAPHRDVGSLTGPGDRRALVTDRSVGHHRQQAHPAEAGERPLQHDQGSSV